MRSTDLFIVAAGDGSRLQATVPKALVTIADGPCLTTTLQQIAHKFRRVFVVTNVFVRNQWLMYFEGLEASYPELARLVVNVPIRSGLGDGHATLEGIRAAERMDGAGLESDVVIAWGDAFFPHEEIIDEMLSIAPKGSGLLPAVYENHPYVALRVNEQMQCQSAEFSKFGETGLTGFHDQSVFRFDLARLRTSLCDLHNALWRNGRYMTPNGEFSLLYSFHQLYNAGDPAYVYETRYPTLSFNTIEEVAAIQREISTRWQTKSRSGRLAANLAVQQID